MANSDASKESARKFYEAAVRIQHSSAAEAIDLLKQALKLDPNFASGHKLLGQLLLNTGKPGAVTHLKCAASITPNDPQSYLLLALAYIDQNSWPNAIGCLTRAIELKPDYSQALTVMARAMQSANRIQEAKDYLIRALKGDAETAEAHNDLGALLGKEGKILDASEHYRRATQLNPDLAVAWNNLGSMLRRTGRVNEAIECGRKAVALALHKRDFHSNLLYWLHSVPGGSGEEILAESRAWAARHAAPAAAPTDHGNDRDPARKLRVAIISPDIRDHSVAFFLEPFVSLSLECEVFCYADVATPDSTTARFKARFSHWRETHHVADDAVAKMVRDDKIDVLIDLAGHTSNSRLGVLTLRPAPIQMTYLGYPGTTGVAAVDYRITDAWADPADRESYCTEELLRLPCGFLCYTPPDEAPPAAPPPCLSKGHITFGSFNALAKTNDDVVKLWSDILIAVPKSELFLKNESFNDEKVQAQYSDLFAKHGITRERLRFSGTAAKRGDHLRLYNEIDIALDPFPYNGTTTTCEALWMGVPVIALSGEMHVSRVSVSLLSRVGLPDLLTKSGEDYLSLAVKLAAGPQRLKKLREGLRAQMAVSPLCDLKYFSAQLEQALRSCWQKWCGQRHPVAAPSSEKLASAKAQTSPTLEKISKPAECALLADAVAKMGFKTLASRYAADGLSRLQRGEPAGEVPSLLLSDWQAATLETALTKQKLSYGHVSSYYDPSQARELIAWATAEPDNLEPLFRSGLVHAVDSAKQGLPVPRQAIEAITFAARNMPDPRPAKALELILNKPKELTLPYDGTEICVYPDIKNLSTYVLLEQGDWFEEDLDLFRALIRPGDTVLDLGANIGVFAISAAQRVGEKGKVVAVEPAAETFALLSKSAQRHPTLKVRCAAISGSAGTAYLSTGRAPELNRVSDTATGGAAIEMISIDNLTREFGISKTNLIKMDLEGHEVAALNGAQEHLKHCSPIIFHEIWEGTELNLSIVAKLRELGFHSFQYNPARKALVRYEDGMRLDWQALNLIAAREDGIERLAETVTIL
jgi:protein O-GlcNAc transferase